MNKIKQTLWLTVVVSALSLASCTTMTERPQPRVFLWTHGHFRNTNPSDPFTDPARGPDLFLALSYCGQDDGDVSFPPLDVVSNVELRVAGRPTPFTLDASQTTSREHIGVIIPMKKIDWVQNKAFEVEWRVGSMRSNVLLADLSEASVESTTLYPTTPRPQQLRGVKKMTYTDYNWWERENDRVLDKQRQIFFFFNGNGPKPWRFCYWSLAYVYGVKGTNITLETQRSLSGDISNEDVLAFWNRLGGLGVPMPSWRDGPKTETGQNWEWFFYTGHDGKRVFPDRNEEYYQIARTLERPLKIEFDHEPSKTESSCEYAIRRDSHSWKAITDAFLEYTKTKESDASFQTEVTVLRTEGDDQPCVAATLKELLSRPEDYHGRRVRVTGYYHVEFEHSSLSAGRDSIREYKDSVWLGGESHFAKPEDVVSQNDAYLTVEGTFTAGPEGHLGLWAGAINRLTKIEKSITEQSPVGDVLKAAPEE